MSEASKRELLSEDTVLMLSEHMDGSDPKQYRIRSVIAEGGSAVCYEAVREDDGKPGKSGKLKEFYPMMERGSLHRMKDDWHLVAGAGTIRHFRLMCDAYVEPHRRLGELMLKDKPEYEILRNYIQDSTILYAAPLEGYQSTIYVWTPGFSGETLEKYYDGIAAHYAEDADQKLMDILCSIRTLTKGIMAMHTVGLLHLDIKPSNLLIHYSEVGKKNPEALSFFDINTVTMYRAGVSLVSKDLGTDGYRAPELKMSSVTRQSDIYSIGATLYSAVVVTGNQKDRLFDENNYGQIASRVKHSYLIENLLSGKANRIRDKIITILQKCLAHLPERRYNSCTALIKDLEDAITLCRHFQTTSLQYISRECVDPKAVIKKLLYKHPLYTHLTPGKKQLDVLVLGDDNFAQLFIDNALQSAQMHECFLSVRVIGGNPQENRMNYTRLRPAIERFVHIKPLPDAIKGMDIPAEPTSEQYGAIQFEAWQKLFRKGNEYREDNYAIATDLLSDNVPDYIFISLDDISLTQRIAVILNDILYERGSTRPICYISQRDTEFGKEHKRHDMFPVNILENITDGTIFPRLNHMAFNTHISWSGTLNIDMKEQFAKFMSGNPTDRYNYHSSISFVLSIKYKLFSIGILLEEDRLTYESLYREADPAMGYRFVKDMDEAARLFYQTFLKEPSKAAVINSLIALEHKRWVLEKVCDGWLPTDESDPNRTLAYLVDGSPFRKKVHDQERGIHPCIAFSTQDTPLRSPAYTENSHRLWDKSPISPELDELDRISVMLHQCFAAAAERNRPDINRFVKYGEQGALQQLVQRSQETTKNAFRHYELCLQNILNKVESYAQQYQRFEKKLKAAVDTDAKLQPSDKTRAKQLIQLIHQFYYPFIQALSYTDYKDNDRVLIENIPFILTYRPCKALAAPFSDGRYENYRNEACFPNVASLTVLCPEEMHYFYACDEATQPQKVREKLLAVMDYLHSRDISCRLHFSVLYQRPAPDDTRRQGIVQELLRLLSDSKIDDTPDLTANKKPTVSLITVNDMPYDTPQQAQKKAVDYCQENSVSLFDGSSRLFHSERQNAGLTQSILAASLPYFEFDRNHQVFCEQDGCEYLTYIRDHSYITVNDMFSLMSASDRESDTPFLSDKYERLKALYFGASLREHALSKTPRKVFTKEEEENFCANGVANWTRLCETLRQHFKNHTEKIMLAIPSSAAASICKQVYIPASCEKKTTKLLEELRCNGIIDRRSCVQPIFGEEEYRVDLFVKPGIANAVLSIFNHEQFDKCEIRTEVRTQGTKKTLTCYFDSRTAENVSLAYEKKPDETDIYIGFLLEALEEAGAVRNLCFSSDRSKASFSFPSYRLKKLLTTAGNILEVYVYYEVLKTNYFDDICMGYSFSWYGDRVDNELDLVLTKGFRSIIVECKAVTKLEAAFYHKLHSIASQFGIGNHTVIVSNDQRYRSDNVEANDIQIQRGNQLQIKTFSGFQQLQNIGQSLKEYMERGY